MNKPLVAAIAAFVAMAAAPMGWATTVSDPVGDFLPSYTGPQTADLDVTSFSVSYDQADSEFLLNAVLAGPIDPSTVGVYAIGVNTGTGVIAPFAPIGSPDVIFNQAIVVQKDGTGSIGGTALDPSSIQIKGDSFSLEVPLALLPSTGFTPYQYGFNLWPRDALGANNHVADFAPNNATLASGAPEPATWAMMTVGLFAAGAFLRRRTGVADAGLASV